MEAIIIPRQFVITKSSSYVRQSFHLYDYKWIMNGGLLSLSIPAVGVWSTRVKQVQVLFELLQKFTGYKVRFYRATN